MRTSMMTCQQAPTYASTPSCVGALRVSEEEYQATPPPVPLYPSIPLSDVSLWFKQTIKLQFYKSWSRNSETTGEEVRYHSVIYCRNVAMSNIFMFDNWV